MEAFAGVNGIEICYEAYGDPAAPAVLIIMGSGAPGVAGPDGMTARLVDAGYRIVRYDARDTGKSTHVDFATHPYTLTDMAEDAIGLLDVLDVPAAHLFGGSMGGMVAQEITIGHPDRVLSLTSFMSTPAIHTADLGEWTSGLPPIQPKVVEAFAELGAHPPTTPAERVEFGVRLSRVLAGTKFPFDEKAERPVIEARSTRMGDTQPNHGPAISRSRDRTALLGSVTVPTLVIHGTEDPIIPYEHGVATAKAIPGAKLWTVEGLGHELPTAFLPELLDALLDHMSATSR